MLERPTLLKAKLEEFIRKYYKNQLIRGCLYSASVFLAFYLLVSLLESFGRFDTGLRTILFYVFVLTNGFIFAKLIFVPLFKLYKIGKTITYDEAAIIIGKHFSKVQDKLLNTLQLQKQTEQALTSSDLLEASINQRINELSPIPFSSAINLRENRKYIKFLALPTLLLLFIGFCSPKLITSSTVRLLKHRTYFEKPSPFHFVIQNKSLRSIQQEDFELDVKLEGDEIPNDTYIKIDGNQYKLDKENTLSFHYLFKNLQSSTKFQLTDNNYTSKEYELIVLPNPLVLNFEAELIYPSYIEKATETLKNTGDLTIPAGTKVKWDFNTLNTKTLKMFFGDSAYNLPQTSASTFSFTKRFLKSNVYGIISSNEYIKSKDSIRYNINVIPDLFPGIEVEQQHDSLSTKLYYFKGVIKDDYGFNKLLFHYRFLHRDSASVQLSKDSKFVELPIQKKVTQQAFYYAYDFSSLNVRTGDEIEYYFEVWDNDGVAGSKSSKSQIQVFKAPTLAELADKAEQSIKEIKNDLKESINEAKKLQKELEALNRKLIDKKELSWEDKKKAEELIQREKSLEKKIDDAKKEHEQTISQQKEYEESNKNIAQKREELNDLMDKVLTEGMKKQLEELQKMMDNVDKEKLQDLVEKMKFDNKNIEKELDRSLELFKQLEFQQKLQDNIDNLNHLAEKQKELSKETAEKNDKKQDTKKADEAKNVDKKDSQEQQKNTDKKDADKKSDDALTQKQKDKNADNNKDLQQKQNELSKQFEQIQKDLKDLEQKDKALENPNNFSNPEQKEENIKQDQQSSEQQLAEKKNKKAAQSQKNASDKMEDLAQQLEQKQSQSQQEQMEENMESLRRLLKGLVMLSFDQEDLMGSLKTMDINNPQYLKVSQKERDLKDDAKMIEDSVFALSKRMVQIQPIVNREISAINQNIDKSLDMLEDRNVGQAGNRQQLAMTSINNLSLLLNEVMQQMQKEMDNAKPGMSSCNKPGGKSKQPMSAATLKKMQEQLNKQMEQMKPGEKPNGKMPNGKQNGKNNQQGQNGMSEQLARMAAQQEAIRNEMQKMNRALNKDAKNGLGDLDNIAKKMEETETDLVNKRLTIETLNRQKEILTKLLEAEKAERERDLDEKRESHEGKSDITRNPSDFSAYQQTKMKEMELLKTVPPSLRPFYKKKVDDYFQSIQ